MITISLCMIVRDEEATLTRCLSSVRDIAEEIVIVDTGSADRTKEIASAFTDHVYDFAWTDDFAAARNYAFSKATREYILWLDADDVLAEPDRLKFLQLKETLDPGTDSVTMPYHLSFDAEGKAAVSLRRNRLVRRDRQFRWEKPIHELLAVSGTIVHSDIAIAHRKQKPHSDRNLRIYRRRAEENESFDARDLYYFANELKDHACYSEAIQYYERFLDTNQGWSEDNFSACLQMAACWAQANYKAKQLQALLRTLHYGPARAEMCCQTGAYFFGEDRLRQAAFWFKLATTLGKPDRFIGMVDHAAWTWLPHLQLSQCYGRLGEHAKARLHAGIASVYRMKGGESIGT